MPYASPGQYIFTDPDTGREYKAFNKQALITQIESYRAQNSLPPIEFLPAVLENYWCSLPENAGKCQRSNMKRGFKQYIKGGIALIKHTITRNFVTEEQALARARICVKCPANQFPNKSTWMKHADEIAQVSTGGKKTELDSQLGNCAVCTCVLKAKIWFKGPFDLEPEQLPVLKDLGCWQPGAPGNVDSLEKGEERP